MTLEQVIKDSVDEAFKKYSAVQTHDLLSVSQAAIRCHVTENTIRKWARDGEIKFIGKGRSTRYIIPV